MSPYGIVLDHVVIILGCPLLVQFSFFIKLIDNKVVIFLNLIFRFRELILIIFQIIVAFNKKYKIKAADYYADRNHKHQRI